jgi:hypothetical protein
MPRRGPGHIKSLDMHGRTGSVVQLRAIRFRERANAFTLSPQLDPQNRMERRTLSHMRRRRK